MRILITNDDGFDAVGLSVMKDIADSLDAEVWTLAPRQEQSGRSRAVSMNAAFDLHQHDERSFSLDGTPCDCVIAGLDGGLDSGPFDLVLSGVNHGQNLAEDTGRSGTIGAAIQAMQTGVRAAALSQSCGFRSGRPVPWETAGQWGPRVLTALLRSGWHRDVIMNVNFPDLPPDEVAGTEITWQGRRDHPPLRLRRLDGNGKYCLDYTDKLSSPPEGSDLRAIYSGRISITPLHADMTHADSRHSLRERLCLSGL